MTNRCRLPIRLILFILAIISPVQKSAPGQTAPDRQVSRGSSGQARLSAGAKTPTDISDHRSFPGVSAWPTLAQRRSDLEIT